MTSKSTLGREELQSNFRRFSGRSSHHTAWLEIHAETKAANDSGCHLSAYHEFSSDEIDGIRSDLLTWYRVEKRNLPWRKDFDENVSRQQQNQRAYEVWISEIMLQQTQVNTVIAYFERWIEKWPTLAELARASEEEVRELWSGLGYYSRATRILEAARYIVAKLNGNFPSDPVVLAKQIPGVGPYTAGAIASIAFNRPAELVDGNVVRVLSRLRSIAGDPTAKATVALYWKLARELVDPRAPGDFNQALMDLGATVCVPTGPVPCAQCPVSAYCHAYKESRSVGRGEAAVQAEPKAAPCSLCLPLGDMEDGGAVTRYPVKAAKKGQKAIASVFYIFEAVQAEPVESVFLVTQRPPKGLLASLWQLPTIDSDEPRCLAQHEQVQNQIELGAFVHLFTHIRQTVAVQWIVLRRGFATDPASTRGLLKNFGMDVDAPFQWLPRSHISRAAITKSLTKAFELLDQHRAQQNKRRSKGSVLHYFSKREKP